ncbi:class I SAM-dependent methyltransferase [Aromatoleum toluclasticum]|uniref:class I SAM-dependent methyltransferase n=1 Tax=Aromatoleum toluclasticum TaxID=92003 RepID=UPI001D186791|nr:class I SAM-dependent methyltransferase [Aromatoleum toluclasticum]MCC4115632.1 class I SAM-dependent methyltransferase [Aromatoleum toluclasticum]
MEPEIYRDMAKIQDQHWWFAARREILSVVISRLPLPSQSATNILEIGCGTGGNLGMLSRFGKISAVEMDDFARRQAELVGETLVKPGALPAPLPFPARAFDLVCVFDVLEHVEDDASGLAAAGQMAHRGGRILITVPAYNWLFGAHDRAHHHFRRYTANDLGRLARAAGLKIERIGYFNTLLFPVIAATRLMERFQTRISASDAVLPSPTLNFLLKNIFATEARIVARTFFPFGTSVIAILSPQ